MVVLSVLIPALASKAAKLQLLNMLLQLNVFFLLFF